MFIPLLNIRFGSEIRIIIFNYTYSRLMFQNWPYRQTYTDTDALLSGGQKVIRLHRLLADRSITHIDV